MSIQEYQEKIREKRKQTIFRDFIMEIGSWATFTFQKNNWLISKFPKTERIKKIITTKEFQETRDELLKKGKDYDFSKNFFENYKTLFLETDIFQLIDYGGNQNADYSDMALNSKNVYMCVAVINNCENILYGISVKDNCTNVINWLAIWANSENIYQSTSILNSYKIFYSKFLNNCREIYFSSNLNGCNECIFCDSLENASYHIKNKSYSKEEYLEEKKKILKEKEKFLDWFLNLPKGWKNINSHDVVGSAVINSENVKNGYFSYNSKNGKNLILVWGIDGNENMFDVIFWWARTANNLYGIMWANGENIYNSMNITWCSQIYYSYFLNKCSHCLGCIGLQNKSYCILNKQYSKEEWEILAEKIFSQMENDNLLWKFFPWYINPFYFNDTLAFLLWNFSKEEVTKAWFMWRDEKIKVDIPENIETIEIRNLSSFQGFDSNGNWKISPLILEKIIKDEKWNYYRITKHEYDFLMKYSLPLPEIHWMDRIKINFWF